MSLADTVVSLIPDAFATAEALVEKLGSPRASAAVGFGKDIVTYVIRAEQDGLSPETVAQGIGDLYVDFVEQIKLGVR